MKAQLRSAAPDVARTWRQLIATNKVNKVMLAENSLGDTFMATY